MIFADPPYEGAMSELQVEVRQAKETKWYRRLKIVQLSMTKMSVSERSEQFDLCPATVRNYIKSYNDAGIEGLKPGKSLGRPPKVAQLKKEDWESILRQTPFQYEKLGTDSRHWTLELLARYAKEYLDQPVHLDTISKALRRCKYRTGRSKLRISSPDPDYCVKRETAETLGSLPKRGN